MSVEAVLYTKGNEYLLIYVGRWRSLALKGGDQNYSDFVRGGDRYHSQRMELEKIGDYPTKIDGPLPRKKLIPPLIKVNQRLINIRGLHYLSTRGGY